MDQTLHQRTAFFVSDSTGLTAESLGQSLLSQFDSIQFERIILPYIDSVEKAQYAVDRINAAAKKDQAQPILFDTVVNQEVRQIIAQADAFIIDVFGSYLSPLEQALGVKSSYTVGRSHPKASDADYSSRIKAVHYALENDDGQRLNRYHEAELILVGVSRSGKTPCSLYLAMQHGVFAANYPLTEDELLEGRLPRALQDQRARLFGLTIDPERLAAIRNERKANSRYADLTQCEDEVRHAEGIFRRFGIPFIDTTSLSVEEIATRILVAMGFRGRAG